MYTATVGINVYASSRNLNFFWPAGLRAFWLLPASPSHSKPMLLGKIARDGRAVVASQGAFEDDYFGHFPVEKLRGFSSETAQLENTSLTRVRLETFSEINRITQNTVCRNRICIIGTLR